MSNASNKLTGPFLVNLRNTFNEIAGADKLIDRNEFKQGLDIRDDGISNRLFDLFDSDHNGYIDSFEFMSAIEVIVNGNEEDKIRFAFDIHDVDASGYIDRRELRVLIEQSFIENNLDFDDFQLDFLVDEFFSRGDADKSGTIDFNEFLEIARKYPDFITGFAVNPVSWLNPDRYKKTIDQVDEIITDSSLQVQDLGAIEWLLIPRMIYMYNMLLNRKKNRSFVDLEAIHLLPSRVMELVIRPPENFMFLPGDYLYINCPPISKIKWYPFTIIRQDDDGNLIMHVKSNNSWTQRLYDDTIDAIKKSDTLGWPLRIDGPYGSSTNRIMRSEQPILVGAGHGVTKLAPILQDIAIRYRDDDQDLAFDKIHLYWLIVDDMYFEWFIKLLQEIEFIGDTRFFYYHMYFIDKNPLELKDRLLYLKTDILNGKTDITLLDDHGIKTHIGLPDWNKEMSRIKKNTGTNKVDLFYCGPSKLKGKLQKECLKQDISYSQRKF